MLFDRFASEEEETAVITYLLDSLPLVTSVITKHDIKPFFFFLISFDKYCGLQGWSIL